MLISGETPKGGRVDGWTGSQMVDLLVLWT